MRQDKKRTEHNKIVKDSLKGLIKNMRREPKADQLTKVQSALDRAVKVNIIHKNQAARLKSRLSHLITSSK